MVGGHCHTTCWDVEPRCGEAWLDAFSSTPGSNSSHPLSRIQDVEQGGKTSLYAVKSWCWCALRGKLSTFWKTFWWSIWRVINLHRKAPIFFNSVFTLSGTGQEKEAAISQVWAVQMCILQTRKLCMQSTSGAGLITQAVRSCPCNHEKEFNPEGCVRKEGRKVECAHNPCAGDMDTSRAWRLVSQPVYLT